MGIWCQAGWSSGASAAPVWGFTMGLNAELRQELSQSEGCARAVSGWWLALLRF